MMMRTGQVKAVSSRDFQSTKLWSFQLEGSDRYYRTGKEEPPLEEGQWVEFEEKNGIVTTSSIKTVESKRAVASAEAVSETAPATSVSTGDVGKRIRIQAARADATRLVCAALEHDQLPHPSNVAKGKRLDLLLGYIEEVTQALLKQEDAA